MTPVALRLAREWESVPAASCPRPPPGALRWPGLQLHGCRLRGCWLLLNIQIGNCCIVVLLCVCKASPAPALAAGLSRCFSFPAWSPA